MEWLFIFIGGGLGSLLRYALTFIPFFNPSTTHPLPTLAANVLASLFLGYLSYLTLNAVELPSSVKLGLTVGLCGGLSTFSTFTAESFELIQAGQLLEFFLYALGSIVLCLAAFLIGIKIAGA